MMKTPQEYVKEGRNPLGQCCTKKMVRRGKSAGRVRCEHPNCQKMATVKVENIRRKAAGWTHPVSYICSTCEQIEKGNRVLDCSADGYIATTDNAYDGGVWVNQQIVKWEDREQLKPRKFYCEDCQDTPGGCTSCNDDLYYAAQERIEMARRDGMTVTTDNPGHSNAFSSR